MSDAPPSLPMAKDEPERAFSHIRVVAPDEEDENDHTSNVSYLHWVQAVAHQHTDLLGYTIAKYKEIGGVFVVQKHILEYSAPTFKGDRLRVVTWVDDWRPYFCTRRTHILRIEDGSLAAKCDTTWVWLGLPSYKPRRIPLEVKEAFYAPADKSLCDRVYQRKTMRVPIPGDTGPDPRC